jgi:NAD+ kinase
MDKKVPVYRKIAVVYNPDKERARRELPRLGKWLRKKGVSFTVSRPDKISLRQAGMVIALGGDGTVLHAAKQASAWGIPVFGVNVGRLGFLTATEVDEMYPVLAKLLAGHGRIEIRTMLSVRVRINGKSCGPFLALNDCVIRSGATGRVFQLNVSIRGKSLATYLGDGLIIATPTGSTAYSLAAYGPIVYPETDVMLLSPISPHTLALRPLVLPAFEIVSVEVAQRNPSAALCLDGIVMHPLRGGDRIEVRRATEQVQLFLHPDRNFYEVLQNKLKWGGN